MHIKSDEIKNKQDKWVNEKDEKLIDKYLSEYIDLQRNYAFEHNNIIDLLIKIGEKKYGKICSYAHVGEIFFVATEDSVF